MAEVFRFHTEVAGQCGADQLRRISAMRLSTTSIVRAARSQVGRPSCISVSICSLAEFHWRFRFRVGSVAAMKICIEFGCAHDLCFPGRSVELVHLKLCALGHGATHAAK